MNIFKLAKLELSREHKDPENLVALIDRAVIIRNWLDINGKPRQDPRQDKPGGLPIYKEYKERKKYYLKEDNLYEDIFDRDLR